MRAAATLATAMLMMAQTVVETHATPPAQASHEQASEQASLEQATLEQATLEQASLEQVSLEQWRSRHAAPDALLVHDRTSPWRLDPRQLGRIRSGATHLHFAEPLRSRGRETFDYDLQSVLDWRRQHPEIARRERRIQQHVDARIESTPADTLLLVFAGFGHAIRHSIESPHRILYAASAIDEDTRFGSPALRRLRTRLGVVSGPGDRLADRSLSHILGAYVTVATSGNRKSAAARTSDHADHVIWLADRHGMEATRAIDTLPAIEAFARGTLRRVVAAVEGFDAAAPLEATAIRHMNDVAATLSDGERERLARMHPGIEALLESGGVFASPSLEALVRRMQLYRQNGVEIRYVGLE